MMRRLLSLVAAFAAVAVACEGAIARAQDPRIERLVGRMTLEEKVGQLFVTFAYGESATTTDPSSVAANRAAFDVDNAAQLVARYHLGGLIYYTWSGNVADPRQIAALSNGIQRAALRLRVPVPLLISIDQEGGAVARVGPPATQFPGNMALGAGRRVADARRAARITARELRAMGVTTNYAPVADVNVNSANPVIGVRSFGADPALVSRLTAAQVRGYERAGIAATVKHFPGHGDTNTDSHTGVPLIAHTQPEWERVDLPPFAAAVRAGVDSVMTAHIVVPALDPTGDPATLSRRTITGILRDRLGFDGVVVTDALGMQGVREKYGPERVPVLALQAGVDQLLSCNAPQCMGPPLGGWGPKPAPPGTLRQEYAAVLDAVRSGEIKESRLDESVRRILRLKLARGLFEHPYVDERAVGKIVGRRSHAAVAQRIADRATTLIKNEAGLLPLTGETRKVLVCGWNEVTARTLADAIARRGVSVAAHEAGVNPTAAQISDIARRAGEHDLVVVATNRAWNVERYGPGQRDLVRALVASSTPVVAVAVRDPYDIAAFPQARTYVATYSYTAPALESLTRVLFGEIEPRGKLPVTIPAAGDPGQVLFPYGHGLGF